MDKIRVEICVGTSCHLMGAGDIIREIEALPPYLRKRIKLILTNCMDNCNRAPKVRVNQLTLIRTNAREVITAIQEQLWAGGEGLEQVDQ